MVREKYSIAFRENKIIIRGYPTSIFANDVEEYIHNRNTDYEIEINRENKVMRSRKPKAEQKEKD